MSVIETIKNAVSIANEAKNWELKQNLLDVQQIALDMQKEITDLREENKKLKDTSELEKKIKRTPDKPTIITFSDDEEKIPYCGVCWGQDSKRIPMGDGSSINGMCHEFRCAICGNNSGK